MNNFSFLETKVLFVLRRKLSCYFQMVCRNIFCKLLDNLPRTDKIRKQLLVRIRVGTYIHGLLESFVSGKTDKRFYTSLKNFLLHTYFSKLTQIPEIDKYRKLPLEKVLIYVNTICMFLELHYIIEMEKPGLTTLI